MARGGVRALASRLLRAAVSIAPPRAAEWGRAILAELDHVEGDWAALAWALGGTGVLARQALLSALFPSLTDKVRASGEKFFAKETPMRKSTRIAAAACLAASLLFFAAPTFRGALQFTVGQWRALGTSLRGGIVNAWPDGPDYASVVEQARKNHDAHALAFVALHRYRADAAPLADEAVSLDPQLTWIYAGIVGRRDASGDETRIARLKQFDPQNGMPYIVEANTLIFRDRINGMSVFYGSVTDLLWLNAMSAAFQSPTVDTYKDRITALDRDVEVRYGLDDPSETDNEYGLVSGFHPALSNVGSYTRLLLRSGDDLAARGDIVGAERQYKLATGFGEKLQASSRMTVFVAGLLQTPYTHLATFYEKQGDHSQAARYSELAGAMDRTLQNDLATRRRAYDNPSATGRALAMAIAGVVMLLAIAGVLLSVVLTVAKSLTLAPRKLRFDGIAGGIGLISTVGLFLSSATVYLIYRSYVLAMHDYFRDGDAEHLRAIMVFTNNVRYGTMQPLYGHGTFPEYFYGTVIVACAAALIFAIARYFWQAPRPLPTA